MARIAGVDIPREKRVEVALTYIYGLGLPTSQKILAQTNINPDTRVRDLTEEQVNRLREQIGEARRGRPHVHLRARAADQPEDPRPDEHQSGHPRPRPHRGAGQPPARADRRSASRSPSRTSTGSGCRPARRSSPRRTSIRTPASATSPRSRSTACASRSEKRVEVALTYIYGLGRPTSQKILTQTNINPDTRVRDLTEEQVNRLRELIDRRYKVEGDLRREVALNIKRLIEIGSYRGLRHRRNLPVRGQRTKTNARQRRGPKKTVGVRRKK